MVSPWMAWTSWPSSLKPTRGRSDFMGEVLLHAADRVGGGLAEAADGRVAHDLGQVLERRGVPARRFHQRHRLGGAHAARRALAAAFVGEEAHDVERGVAGLVV